MASPIYTTGDPVWNSLEDNTRVPLTSELESGWPCGEVDHELLNFVSGHGWNLIHNMLTLSGLTPSIPNLHQLAQAVQTGKVNYAVAGGTANAITATLSPVPASLALLTGAPIRLKIANANTGSVTVNINGLGATALLDPFGYALPAGYIQPGIIEIAFDETAFRLLASNPSSVPFSVSNNSSQALSNGVQAAVSPGANQAFTNVGSLSGGSFTFSRPGLYMVSADVTINETVVGVNQISGRMALKMNGVNMAGSAPGDAQSTSTSGTYAQNLSCCVALAAPAGGVLTLHATASANSNYTSGAVTSAGLAIWPIN